MAKTQAGCANVVVGLFNIAMDTPVIPLDADLPQQPAPEVSQRPQPYGPPKYEHHIEPIIYAIGHGFSMLASLGILWMLLQGPMEPRRVITALVMWGVCAFCSYKALLGVRYGCTMRLYKGHLELTVLGPTRVITAGEVAYFREFHRYNNARRKILVYLRSGQVFRLPRVHNPDNLWRSLIDDVGLEQMIAGPPTRIVDIE
jgi:hypothetical protein